MFNHTLCARLHATKSKCRLSVSDTHRPVSSAGLLELCQWSHHIVSESNRVAKNTPGWQPARCTDMSHCWQTASSSAALAQRPPHYWLPCAPLDGVGSRGPRWQLTPSAGFCMGRAELRVSVRQWWGDNPSLCYLLVSRCNQNKLWCLMTSSLHCAKHLKKSKVPQKIMWMTVL